MQLNVYSLRGEFIILSLAGHSGLHSRLANYSAFILVIDSYTGTKRTKVARILEFITFYQNALHLTRVHRATFYQNALPHERL